MISLRKTIEDIDYRLQCQTVLDSYRSAVEALERHVAVFDRDSLAAIRGKLLDLRNRLRPGVLRLESLPGHSADLENTLGEYRLEIEALFHEARLDLRNVVGALANAAESLSQRDYSQGGQLFRISSSLEEIAQAADIGSVRRRLHEQVRELRACIAAMGQDSETALESLNRELAGFRQKLEKAQMEASTDALTGIPNRRSGNREIAARIRDRRSFGVMLFDLNKFKQINDTYGHGAGDAVLRVVAQRLCAQIRAGDMACRWGGDEFVVIQDGGGLELAARGEEITGRIGGTVSVEIGGAARELAIGAEFGYAEYRPGESAEQLMAKADGALYATKARVLSAPPAIATTQIADSCWSDPATGLRGLAGAEAHLQDPAVDPGGWTAACFAIRNAIGVDAHYGFAASERILPFLRDEILASRCGQLLFRGPGASLVALVSHGGSGAPLVPNELERELQRITAVSFEKHLALKRRASVLPVVVAGKLIAFDKGIRAGIEEAGRFAALLRACV